MGRQCRVDGFAPGRRLVAARLGGTWKPFFGRPLWLRTRRAGRVLRAYDAEHVDTLAAYMGGTGATRAMFPRRPRWMKSSARRAEVPAGLRRLRALCALSAPADRSEAAHERSDRPRPHGVRYLRSSPC
ncbi:hypothetical protein [Streptomyces griseofuscus]|uniref:hypothetical protein n=1 Tax=Streptomyces griseofuscus TaxID=146922 RepID=UPI003425867D